MTERGAGALRRDADHLAIGPSTLAWDGAGLTVRIQEVGMPLPRRVSGTLRLIPQAVESRTRHLDRAGRHRWQPIAPCARVEVRLTRPSLSWSGPAYFDTNDGDRPLEADFIRWHWARAPAPAGTAVVYDVERPDGAMALAMRYAAAGGVEDMPPPPRIALPATAWRLGRAIRADQAGLRATLEDTPFYARSAIDAALFGARATAVHESLSMTRFTNPLVQAMLPFRMPRVGG